VDTRSWPGGSLRVLEFIEDHGPALAYDFRHRFNLSIFDIGTEFTFKEAVYLIGVLIQDPSSWFQASYNKWKYPISREGMVSLDYFDAFAMANSKKKPKPYPRPWPKDGESKIGSKRQRREDVIAKLNKMNPQGE